MPKGLPEGRYRIVSRVVTEWGNEPLEDDNTVELTLVPSVLRKKK